MPSKDSVRIAPRFLRSIRIDSDLGAANSLEGFICPESFGNVIKSMADHVSKTGQSAFTWTGPYGSGKSSLAVAFAALLSGKEAFRTKATEIFGKRFAKNVWNSLPPKTNGWKILPVVARRESPVQVIGDALLGARLITKPECPLTEHRLIEHILRLASSRKNSSGGIVIFIDEMGKFLESAALDGQDIFILQQLAEAASRSEGRLIVIGILHQSFEEYANRLSQDVRDEWSKVQGRFIDLSVNAAGEEQLELISRAIESKRKSKVASPESLAVADTVKKGKASDKKKFALLLERCWPLHPVVACLLGPISRRGFGQNQRSIFGFLNSCELYGFQEFLTETSDDNLYDASRLWDYLRANLEPSILASSDGHRWASASEVVERCEANNNSKIDIDVLKTVAIIDLFKEKSGLIANSEILKASFPELSTRKINASLKRLKSDSYLIFRKYHNAYSLYAGSDFNIEQAVKEVLEDSQEVNFDRLRKLAKLQPLLAKRHYHQTGVLRWFDLDIVAVSDLAETVEAFDPNSGSMGRFLLAVPTKNESKKQFQKICRAVIHSNDSVDVVVGLSDRSWSLIPIATELAGIERIAEENTALGGDAVARREVEARRLHLQSMLELEIQRAFDTSSWYRAETGDKARAKRCSFGELNEIASEIASERYSKSPRIHNELLNREKPSGSAVGALKALMKLIISSSHKPMLGIHGYPPERGMLSSVLEASGLYESMLHGSSFNRPADLKKLKRDVCRIEPMWSRALDYVKSNGARTIRISELYEIWQAPPFGVRKGILPLLTLLFILIEKNFLSVYREGVFRSKVDDVDIDYMVKDPSSIQVRWMEMTDETRFLLAEMADIVHKIGGHTLTNMEPIDVARGLVAIFDKLPNWTKRTSRLSGNATKVRDTLKHAHDPNALLFDDLSKALQQKSKKKSNDVEGLKEFLQNVEDGLVEVVDAYPKMLGSLRDLMLRELRVPNLSPHSIVELHERARNTKDLTGDFKIDAFSGRLTLLDGSTESFEAIASLAISKPPRDWIDKDLERAEVTIAEMCGKFMRAEMFARVKGRTQHQHAWAVLIGTEGTPEPALHEFVIASSERAEIDSLINRIENVLQESDYDKRNVMLAALAEISMRYMKSDEPAQNGTRASEVAVE